MAQRPVRDHCHNPRVTGGGPDLHRAKEMFCRRGKEAEAGGAGTMAEIFGELPTCVANTKYLFFFQPL